MDNYNDMVELYKSRKAGTIDAIRYDFSHFVCSCVPAGVESKYYIRSIPNKYRIWERLGYWFLRKAGYDLVWPGGTND